MKTLSLKRRIGLCVALMVFIVVCVLSGTAYREFREAIWRSMDIALQSDLQQVTGFVFFGNLMDNEMRQEIAAFLNPKADWHRTEYQIWLTDAETQENTFFASNLPGPISLEGITPPPVDGFILMDLEHNQKPYRAIWAIYRPMDQSFSDHSFLNILIMVGSKDAYHETTEFIKVLVIVGAIVVWASFGLTEQILRWGFRPINDLANRMGQISHDNLNKSRQDCPVLYRELTPFVRSFEAMLQRLSDAMQEQKRFTADAAHELKTPVALVKSTLQLAQSQKRTPEYYEQSIEGALEDVDRLGHLVDQLLDLSRIENVDIVDTREDFDLQSVIEDSLDYYRPLAEKKGYVFRGELCTAVISGYRSQIEQLFSNLIDNAVKYAPPQTTITVSMRIFDSRVSVSVHDEGGNISENDCELLFNRFYRVANGRDRHSGGTGLGLAIAQKITELHNGDIRVESGPQIGTTFVVMLPLCRSVS